MRLCGGDDNHNVIKWHGGCSSRLWRQACNDHLSFCLSYFWSDLIVPVNFMWCLSQSSWWWCRALQWSFTFSAVTMLMWCLVVMSWPAQSVVTRVLRWFSSRFAEPQIPPWEMSWKWRMKALLINIIFIITICTITTFLKYDFNIPWSPSFIPGVQNPPGLTRYSDPPPQSKILPWLLQAVNPLCKDFQTHLPSDLWPLHCTGTAENENVLPTWLKAIASA